MRDQKTWSVRFISVLGVALVVGVLLALGSTAASARPAADRPGPRARRQRPCGSCTLSRIDATAPAWSSTRRGRVRSSSRLRSTSPTSASRRFIHRRVARHQLRHSTRCSRPPTGRTSTCSRRRRRPSSPSRARRAAASATSTSSRRTGSDPADARCASRSPSDPARDRRRIATPAAARPKTVSDCPLLRGVVLLPRPRLRRVGRAATSSPSGGVAYLEGHRGHWTVSASDRRRLSDAGCGARRLRAFRPERARL